MSLSKRSLGRTSARLRPCGSIWQLASADIVAGSMRSSSKTTLSALPNACLAFSGTWSQTLVYGTWIVPKKYEGGSSRVDHRNDEEPEDEPVKVPTVVS